ncbi:hypothetical protein GYH30_003051 [Glycine max]|nr:hypothetical protein GYH30_003051 [Glycine max]KHN00491.1 hypothetical protein glysoja_000159 [Glycine soja]
MHSIFSINLLGFSWGLILEYIEVFSFSFLVFKLLLLLLFLLLLYLNSIVW